MLVYFKYAFSQRTLSDRTENYDIPQQQIDKWRKYNSENKACKI